MLNRLRASFIDHTTPASRSIRLQADTATQAGGMPPEFPAPPLTPCKGEGTVRQNSRSTCMTRPIRRVPNHENQILNFRTHNNDQSNYLRTVYRTGRRDR